MRIFPKFDLVTILLAAAGRVQERRNQRAKQRVINLRAALVATTEALQVAEKVRNEVTVKELTRVV